MKQNKGINVGVFSFLSIFVLAGLGVMIFGFFLLINGVAPTIGVPRLTGTVTNVERRLVRVEEDGNLETYSEYQYTIDVLRNGKVSTVKTDFIGRYHEENDTLILLYRESETPNLFFLPDITAYLVVIPFGLVFALIPLSLIVRSKVTILQGRLRIFQFMIMLLLSVITFLLIFYGLFQQIEFGFLNIFLHPASTIGVSLFVVTIIAFIYSNALIKRKKATDLAVVGKVENHAVSYQKNSDWLDHLSSVLHTDENENEDLEKIKTEYDRLIKEIMVESKTDPSDKENIEMKEQDKESFDRQRENRKSNYQRPSDSNREMQSDFNLHDKQSQEHSQNMDTRNDQYRQVRNTETDDIGTAGVFLNEAAKDRESKLDSRSEIYDKGRLEEHEVQETEGVYLDKEARKREKELEKRRKKYGINK